MRSDQISRFLDQEARVCLLPKELDAATFGTVQKLWLVYVFIATKE